MRILTPSGTLLREDENGRGEHKRCKSCGCQCGGSTEDVCLVEMVLDDDAILAKCLADLNIAGVAIFNARGGGVNRRAMVKIQKLSSNRHFAVASTSPQARVNWRASPLLRSHLLEQPISRKMCGRYALGIVRRFLPSVAFANRPACLLRPSPAPAARLTRRRSSQR